MWTRPRWLVGALTLVISTAVLSGCAADSAPATAPADATGSTQSSAPLRGDLAFTGPSSGAVADTQAMIIGTNCDRAKAHETACVYYQSNLAAFTGPGPSAIGGLTLQSFSQWEDHGTIHNNHGPTSPLASQTPTWASYESNGAGIQAYVKYHVVEDPFRTSDEVGWEVEMPYTGKNGGHCITTEFLLCDMTLPGEDDLDGDYFATFYNRPLAIQIHNNVQGLELTKRGAPTYSGLLVDPKATNEPAADAVLTYDGSGTGDGRAYYGGYRSNANDATFSVQYQATKAAVAADIGTTFNIALTVSKDDPNKALPATVCSVSSPTSTVRLKCAVQVTGSNQGQSRATVEISKN